MKTKQLIALAGVLAVTLAACSDPGAGKKPEAKPSSGSSEVAKWPEATAKLDGTTLKIWAAQSSNKIPAGVAKEFEKATGAKVEIVTIPDGYEQNVLTKVATGDKPDLAMWQPTASMLLPINAKENLLPLDGAPWESKYADGVLDYGGTLDGKRYAAFVSAPSTMGVWYNKEVFEKNGAKIPKNFDELLTLARDLKAKGQTPLNEMGGEWWASQWTVQVLVGDASKDGLWDKVNKNEDGFTGPALQGAIDKYASMIKEGLYNEDIKTGTFDQQARALLDGKAAMAIATNSLLSNMASLTDAKTLNDKIGFFPISEKGNRATNHPEQTNAVVAFKTGDAKREAAARQFLTFWLTKGYQSFIDSQNTVSIMKDGKTPKSVPQAAIEANDALKGSVGSMQAQAIANPDLAKNLGDMIAGTKTPAQVGEATQAQFVELARAMGAKGF
ncbi:ABC transporter substrate-binding protein [Trueperella pyogenes]|uniref:ABC transporter substrate-binding protein n=1 Tax=Trueperella pyogenes TaxID=1661 RepID=UPI00046A5FCD|nr:ABC transporter substrate-binding protein [Trueperella pyogenes]AZR01404.1 carbohydrate ABC transporter substrate-binding protein [Trueperella pyogenes]AZR02656.1 carbohydrate ABC transporter substrate-binding protein [Trueperella pyogenes]UVJ59836.1 ABC transporter substrate-binding protein [Trueperella pyogenes]WHU58554.1 ABC transporter substrate-binding protein [Trueperella pyogenes]